MIDIKVPAKVKTEIKRAMALIHESDRYYEGMDILAKLADLPTHHDKLGETKSYPIDEFVAKSNRDDHDNKCQCNACYAHRFASTLAKEIHNPLKGRKLNLRRLGMKNDLHRP